MRFYAFCTENTDPEIQGDIFMAKEMIAMLLAGGQGSRLYALTQKLAKPAVELCKFRNLYRWNSDPVPADGVE